MKKIPQILAFLTTLTALCIIAAPITFALDCENFNYQLASSKPAGPADPNVPDPQGVNQPQYKLDQSLADKMVVVTEEPLGTADNINTFRCVRQIVCNTQTPPTTAGAAVQQSVNDSSSASAAITGSSSNTPPLIRKCTTTIAKPGACNPTANSEINNILSSGIQDGQTYTICEPIMVYVSKAGTNLLYYYIGQIYRYVATTGSVIAVLIMIVAGVMRASARDNAETVKKANDMITKTISGLILMFLSAVILYIINPNFFVF